MMNNNFSNSVIDSEKTQEVFEEDIFVFPLSFAQERFWLLEQFRGERAIYNMAGALHLKGQLKIAALQEALAEIVARQEILRTTFPLIDGNPVQAITPSLALPMAIVDLQGMPETQQWDEVENFMEEEIHHRFDLAQGPLWRVRLLKLNSESHVVFLNMHHIISDGWSLGIFLQELSELYRGFVNNCPSPLPEIEIQYADFAEWQREWLKGDVLESQLNYWQEQLMGAPPMIDLPTDFLRPPRQSFQGKHQELNLTPSLTESLQSLSRRQDVSLFVTLLTGLKILLTKWTGQRDLVVGTVIAGRTRPEIEPLIGCFVNFLALRSDLSEEQTAQELLKQIDATFLDGYSHQDCPFEKVVEVVNPSRDVSHNPIYNVALLLQNFPLNLQFDESLEGYPLPVETLTSFLDLRLEAFTSLDKILIRCEYSTDLFEFETIQWLLADYQRILEQLVEQTTMPLNQFQISEELKAKAKTARVREQKSTLAIASTFTSEPIEESLSFWLKELDLPFEIKFAPYNQVFQELLNPASLLATNHNGVNLILIRLEDWGKTNSYLSLQVPLQEKEKLLASQPHHVLPNSLQIAHLNEYETDYLYQEIFIDKVYLRHGIVLNESDCVVDIGANIGLFTLFAQQKCPHGTIYAFEPAPHAFKALQINSQLYCNGAKLFNCGIGGQNTQEKFTFYPKSSVFSSFSADREEDKKAIRAVILNMLRRTNDSLEDEVANTLADEFLQGRLDRQTYPVTLRTLSDIIEEADIKTIDLLKLDAEKSEVAILQGIQDQHWPKIKQIVMEVHDQEGSQLRTVTQLLNQQGFDLIVEEETLLQSSGLYTIYATRQGASSPQTKELLIPKITEIKKNVQDLATSLRSASASSSAPYLLCCSPLSPQAMADSKGKELYEQLEHELCSALEGVSGVSVATSSELSTLYPVEDYYDVKRDELGHIPYTSRGFTALGSLIARKLHALQRQPYKVIALDCDQTLWKGVCGEDGPEGVEMTPAHYALQEFMLTQQAQGKILCLCSKNEESDVFAVFETQKAMPLKQEHFVSWRINWQPKSENLKSLAQELQVGLDSFILVEDNPVECAEVQANCPEVLTVQLPQDYEQIPHFLDHIWAFDSLKVTKEDRVRTQRYQQNAERERLREQTLTFEDFLAELNLQVEIKACQPHQFARIAQLTQRTNQFNLTTIRRSEIEIQQLCESEQLECLVVNVRDRFGDYGLVGVMLFETDKEAIAVDTFLLSCRALGRGVEHQMLAQLAMIAQERGLKWVEVPCLFTDKNQPAQNFLAGVGEQYKQDIEKGWLFRFPVGETVNLTFKPDSASIGATQNLSTSSLATTNVTPSHSQLMLYQRIGTELSTTEQILQMIESQKQWQQRSIAKTFVEPRNSMEMQIAEIWREVLKIEQIGIHDNFFELGGSSLIAVGLMAKIQQKLGKQLPLSTLFQSPTIEKLGTILEEQSGSPSWSSLVPIQPHGSKPPFFCIPGVGGNVIYLQPLAQYLGSDQPFYGLQSVGLDGISQPHTSVEEIAAHYIQVMRSVQPEGPYQIGGHSFGGRVAFEMAQQLQKQGEVVEILAIFDVPAPYAEEEPMGRDWDEAKWSWEIAKIIQHLSQTEINVSYETFEGLTSEEQLNYLTELLQTVKLLPPGADTLQVKGFCEVFKANYQMSYFPQAPQKLEKTRMILFQSDDVDPELYELRAKAPKIFQDPTWGWQEVCQELVIVERISGGHITMMANPFVKSLADRLNTHLGKI